MGMGIASRAWAMWSSEFYMHFCPTRECDHQQKRHLSFCMRPVCMVLDSEGNHWLESNRSPEDTLRSADMHCWHRSPVQTGRGFSARRSSASSARTWRTWIWSFALTFTQCIAFSSDLSLRVDCWPGSSSWPRSTWWADGVGTSLPPEASCDTLFRLE